MAGFGGAIVINFDFEARAKIPDLTRPAPGGLCIITTTGSEFVADPPGLQSPGGGVARELRLVAYGGPGITLSWVNSQR